MSYRFDPAVLHECAKQAVGLNHKEIFAATTQALAEAYPKLIPPREPDWIINNAGGAMGQMTLLYASLSEYILIFGTPIGTEGHSGRYRSEVWDFMLEGEMWCYREGETERSEYKAGDAAYLGANRAKGYRIPNSAWMLEYSRGPIPAMLPFGLADTAFSTLDLHTASKTLVSYTKHVSRNLMRRA